MVRCNHRSSQERHVHDLAPHPYLDNASLLLDISIDCLHWPIPRTPQPASVPINPLGFDLGSRAPIPVLAFRVGAPGLERPFQC